MKSLMCSPERLVADVLHLAGDGAVDHVAPQISVVADAEHAGQARAGLLE